MILREKTGFSPVFAQKTTISYPKLAGARSISIPQTQQSTRNIRFSLVGLQRRVTTLNLLATETKFEVQ